MAFGFQVALLDFGATRGFDASFTDVYIEVKMILTVLMSFYDLQKKHRNLSQLGLLDFITSILDFFFP